jgi:hypothetical protein
MGVFEDQYSSYAYLEDKWFRLVTILPGENPEVICIERKAFAISEAPGYDALSYTWGSTTVDLQHIQCDGSDFVVTNNLFEALSRFRDKTQPRTMWIDAICINQFSDAECTQQIGIMVEIYSQAEEVLVWLGPHNEDIDLEFVFQVAHARQDYVNGVNAISAPPGHGIVVGLFHPDAFYHKTIAAVRQRFFDSQALNLSVVPSVSRLRPQSCSKGCQPGI